MNDSTFAVCRLNTSRSLPASPRLFSGSTDRRVRGTSGQSIPLNIAAGNGKQSLKDTNRFFEIARGSARECASIHEVLRVLNTIGDESDRRGKSDLK